MATHTLDPHRVARHLRARLEQSAVRPLSPQEENVLRVEGAKQFLQKQVLSKKFRKWSADPVTQARVLKAIDVASDAQKPLQVVCPMGGYKLWSLPSAPEADWAEFFNIAYVLQYVSGIAAGYGPGVHVSYFMHTLLPQRHDNLPAEQVQRYVDSFEELLAAFRKHLPRNVTLSITRDANLYTREEYFSTLEERYPLAERQFSSLPEAARDELLKLSRRNIRWDGAEDWTGLTQTEKEEKVRRGAIYELAGTGRMERVHQFLLAEDKVVLFVMSARGFLGIGSTKSSRAKYWIGSGVLEFRDDEFFDLVLSPSQAERTMDAPREVFDCDLLPLRNLRQVTVVKQHLDFTPAR